MCSRDYLNPFVEVDRALCDGADCYSVMHLITRRIAETLDLKGCFIKMRAATGPGLELLSSFGLSEGFLFSRPSNSPDSICFSLPDRTICMSMVREEEEAIEHEAMILEGIRALAVVPVEVEQDTVAMVGLFSHQERGFDRDEMNFSAALAGRGIQAILWKRRFEEGIDRERGYLSSFQEIASTINASLDPKKVLDLVVTNVTEQLHGKGCLVRLLDQKTRKLYLAQAYGLSEQFLTKGPVDAERSISENMEGKTVVIDDVFTDPRLQYRAEVIEEGVRKLLSIPLMIRGKVIGVLRFYSPDRPHFTKREINFATAVAQQCAFAIENARMYQRVKYEYERLLTDFDYGSST